MYEDVVDTSTGSAVLLHFLSLSVATQGHLCIVSLSLVLPCCWLHPLHFDLFALDFLCTVSMVVFFFKAKCV